MPTASRVLPLVRASAYAEGRPLTLAEVRERMEAPPAGAVEWRCSARGRTVTVYAQLWMSARKLGAMELQALPDDVTCRRVDEVELQGPADGLTGKRLA